ncbi:MAG: PAS domain-containing sensor histidine kinase, partial [Firmicutes bacterium]|nr:PAS domain-containing sensor histidine kinase [Bacillota bacterium]
MTFFLVLMGITFIAFIFQGIVTNPDVNITMFYILGIVLVARYTYGYVWGFLFSLLSVISINYFFTFPYHKLNLTLEGYPITFAAMFIIYIMTSAMTTNMKEQAKILAAQEKELMEVQKEKMRANFLRAISHDLRTPLT